MDPKSLAFDPESMDIDPKSIQIDSKSFEIDPESIQIDPKLIEINSNSIKINPKLIGIPNFDIHKDETSIETLTSTQSPQAPPICISGLRTGLVKYYIH